MDLHEVAQARSKVYDLFSRLYFEGATEELLPVIWAVPELAATLPNPFKPDEAAADYQEVLGFNVFPYGSVYLEPDRLSGGLFTDAIYHAYRQGGFDVEWTAESADHIGHALAFLSFLSAAEADALEDEVHPEVLRMQRIQREFLDRYLLPWLPVFTYAVERQGQPFYESLASLTREVILEHRRSLGSEEVESYPLEEPPALLDNPETGLKDIAAYLVTPVWSGLFLSRADIARIGRQKRLPRGFGQRAHMLEDLLRSGFNFDQASALMDQLQKELQTWQSYYQGLEDAQIPGLRQVIPRWKERVKQSRQLVAHIKEAAQQEAPADKKD